MATVFLDSRLSNFDTPSLTITDSGPQCESKFIWAIYTELCKIVLKSIKYHTKTNAQVGRQNETIVFQLCSYVAEHQYDSNSYVTPLAYAYVVWEQWSKSLTAFSLLLSHYPLGPVSSTSKQMSPDFSNFDSPLAMRFLLTYQAALHRRPADKHLRVTEKRYMSGHNKKFHFEPIYAPGDYVSVDRPTLANLHRWTVRHQRLL